MGGKPESGINILTMVSQGDGRLLLKTPPLEKPAAGSRLAASCSRRRRSGHPATHHSDPGPLKTPQLELFPTSSLAHDTPFDSSPITTRILQRKNSKTQSPPSG
ncbi:hypothetical protein OPQ81_001994 [Rhizoctonia solani]|nr:hypothetical protein OPQ81_001994 [Rhizoctonia solani]